MNKYILYCNNFLKLEAFDSVSFDLESKKKNLMVKLGIIHSDKEENFFWINDELCCDISIELEECREYLIEFKEKDLAFLTDEKSRTIFEMVKLEFISFLNKDEEKVFNLDEKIENTLLDVLNSK